VPPRPFHSWTRTRLSCELDRYLEAHEPEAFWGAELYIPMMPFFGRRPDFDYYSTAESARPSVRWRAVQPGATVEPWRSMR
jgi:hypothetical protein